MAHSIAVTEKITNFAVRRHTPAPITIPDTLTFKSTYMKALIKAAKCLIFLALITPPNSVDAATKIGDLYYNLVYPEAYVVPPPAQKVPGISGYTFMGYQLDEVIIPSTVTDGKRTYTVTKIAYDKAQNISNKSYGAFQNSKINRVVIPYTVTTIGTSAFNGSSVVNIDFEAAPDEIDDSSLKIEQNAFTNCTKLEYLELMREHFAQDMTTSNIFSGCKSLKSAVLALTGVLPQGFFSNCTSLQRVEFTNHIESFANNAFSNCTGMMKANGGQGIYFRNTICPGKSFGTSTNEHNNIWGSNVDNNSVEIHVPTYTTSEEMTAWNSFATYGQVYITPVIKDETCGIEEVSGNNTSDATAPVEYYTLQGLRADATAFTPGIYIRRQGTSVTKILIRR